jgi:ATP-dependent 26S proteasome regulatory subunit
MHKFLNVSDGLISAADKKMVFSTNLPNIQDIDSALMRPGRCFDVVEFRPLTREEAKVVVEETRNGKVPEGKSQITLAELFSQQPSAGTARRKGIGFA